eukprot:gene948-263_t
MKKKPRRQHRTPLLLIPGGASGSVEGAFDLFAMDILGPFPVTHSGKRYVIIFFNYYTGWPEALAIPSTEAVRIDDLLVNEILARHGAPKTLLSDPAANFLLSIAKESNTELAQLCMKQQYDKHVAPVPFVVGSRVRVYMPKNRKGLSKKLAHNYHGPQLSPVHFKFHTFDNRLVSVPVHANRMKPYINPASCPISAQSSQDTTLDLVDIDLPTHSFVPDARPILKLDTPTIDTEPTIRHPEDVHTPQTIVPV